MLIPEIDMPGHSDAFRRTFKTDMQSEQGMKILKELLDEICETFDHPYIHIGTDEVQFSNPRFVPENGLLYTIQREKSHLMESGLGLPAWRNRYDTTLELSR